MPRPFPGMDPYLEAPGIWPDVHDRLIFHIGSLLQEALPDHYVALFQQRVELILADRHFVPDVSVEKVREAGIYRATASTAAPRPPDAAVRIAAPLEESVDRYIEVVRTADRELVTVLELASPANKVDSRGRAAYAEKQLSFLRSDVNLVEIDVLRSGGHWAAVPAALARRHEPYDVMVCVSRAEDRTNFECYFGTLREALPSIAVPLRGGDPDVALDLDLALELAYEQGRYPSWVRYDHDPVPPLRPDDRQWARERLVAAGLLHREAAI